MFGSLQVLPEIHPLMFKIFSRLMFHAEENKELSSSYEIDALIYDEYLMDTVKFFDLLTIYPNNSKTIKKMIQTLFNHDYIKNF